MLVDEIEILNKESEDKHIFTIKEAKDSYRSRQKLKYPDGTTVEDTGRAHVDGYSEFKLLNITPGRPVVVLRRMDYVYGDYELEMSVNGKKVSVVSCVGTDRVHRWRNWPAMIAGRARHRRDADHPPAVDHRRPRHQHVPHLGLPAEVEPRRR